MLFSRLQNPYECPFNGSRRQDCACRNDYLAAGFTIFSKIRFDVDSMQIRSKHFSSFSWCEPFLILCMVVITKLSFEHTCGSNDAILGWKKFVSLSHVVKWHEFYSFIFKWFCKYFVPIIPFPFSHWHILLGRVLPCHR